MNPEMTQSRQVRIRVPASAANLGPGYDSFGLALGRYDDVTAERTSGALEITVEGMGAAEVPTDESHLIHRAASRAFAAMGEPIPGLRMHCVNRIPHGGGQGSSAAAIVSGILLARALTPDGPARFDDAAVFDLATDMEGHPDNVAPALFGGFTIAWMAAGGAHARAVRPPVHPAVRAVVLSADDACATSRARAVLPARIPHADAASNAARAGLLVHAMTQDPSVLFDATEDRLHQPYREDVMPHTAELLRRLRGRGLAAVLSGAGPSVLILCTEMPAAEEIEEPGFHADEVEIPRYGAIVDGTPLADGGGSRVVRPGARADLDAPMLQTTDPHR